MPLSVIGRQTDVCIAPDDPDFHILAAGEIGDFRQVCGTFEEQIHIPIFPFLFFLCLFPEIHPASPEQKCKQADCPDDPSCRSGQKPEYGFSVCGPLRRGSDFCRRQGRNSKEKESENYV